MSYVKNIEEQLHYVNVKMYPNYLSAAGVPAGNELVARTQNDKTLTLEDICASLHNRGGHTGNYDDLIENVKQFFHEAIYLALDGFNLNFKYFCMYPKICGTFNSATEPYDRKKNPVKFRFRAQPALRRLVELIEIKIDGLADTCGWIDEFIDTDENSINTLYSPGDQFILRGRKIKIAGNDTACGVYFVPVDDPSKAVRAARIAENCPSKIIGIAPATGFMQNRIEIRTQFTGAGNRFLKEVCVIKSSFTVEEA